MSTPAFDKESAKFVGEAIGQMVASMAAAMIRTGVEPQGVEMAVYRMIPTVVEAMGEHVKIEPELRGKIAAGAHFNFLDIVNQVSKDFDRAKEDADAEA